MQRPSCHPPHPSFFRSGNHCDPSADSNPTPVAFSDREHFLRLAGTKNYRGLLALDEIKLVVGNSGEVLQVTFDGFARTGYTPSGLGHHRGRGSGFYRVTRGLGSVRIEYWLRFKVGALVDFGGWLTTGRWAPSALMKIEYEIKADRSFSARFLGSYIPSQSYYINWNRRSSHDMTRLAATEIDAFLDAGPCTDAPLRFYEVCCGEGGDAAL